MTKEEKDAIFNDFDGITIQSDEPMNLTEMKAYVKGFEDARNAIFDAVDTFYRSNEPTIGQDHGSQFAAVGS